MNADLSALLQTAGQAVETAPLRHWATVSRAAAQLQTNAGDGKEVCACVPACACVFDIDVNIKRACVFDIDVNNLEKYISGLKCTTNLDNQQLSRSANLMKMQRARVYESESSDYVCKNVHFKWNAGRNQN